MPDTRDDNDRRLFLDAVKNMTASHARRKERDISRSRPQEHRSRPRPEFDAVIDLHGLTLREARRCLRVTLQEASGKGRTLLVITGRGVHSGGEPVLQEGIASYLEGPARGLWRDMRTAPPKHGGTGAFIVRT